MTWLHGKDARKLTANSAPEQQKRKEILLEMVYYIFDSILIPLIRFNFHVTESSTHQNRLFYFRHDVWRLMTEPAMRSLKNNMFIEVPTTDANKLLESRPLAFSQVRLLPKTNGLRPIMNLKRRVQRVQSGRTIFGKSINSALKPSLSILKYEKIRKPYIMGASLFSVNDIHPKLRAFRSSLETAGLFGSPFFFVKLDVKACFDTIPQKGILRVVEGTLNADEYQICRHTETKGCDDPYDAKNLAQKDSRKAIKRFQISAHCAHEFHDFDSVVRDKFSLGKRNVAFTDAVAHGYESRQATIILLKDHVENNLIKQGKRFYRQKKGIPQGSVLSTMLCNLFYADMERSVLSFLQHGDSLLLRLIDDFLFISLDKGRSIRFLQTMLNGIADYGAEIHPSKSLANFEVEMDGIAVPVLKRDVFPYCGILVDTQSLEITKDWDRRKKTTVVDTLSIEQSRTPGRILHAKMLSALRIQMLKMFLDTTFNSIAKVLSTIFHSFLETAMKMFRYVKVMPKASQPDPPLLRRTVEDVARTGWLLLQSNDRTIKAPEYTCQIRKDQVSWLAMQAFLHVFGNASARGNTLLSWLKAQADSSMLGESDGVRKLRRIIRTEIQALDGFRY